MKREDYINMTMIGRKHSEETKEKIRQHFKGKKPAWMDNEEIRDEIRERIKQKQIGKKVSLETRKRISEAVRGRERKPHSEETKRKISERHKGRRLTEEHKLKLSKARMGKEPWNKGKTGVQIVWNKGKKMPEMSGDKHPSWVGDKVGYSGVHSWIQKHKGKPQICIDCGVTSKEKRLCWSNVDHEYRRDLDDYQARCTPCHYQYDALMVDEKKDLEFLQYIESEIIA